MTVESRQGDEFNPHDREYYPRETIERFIREESLIVRAELETFSSEANSPRERVSSTLIAQGAIRTILRLIEFMEQN